MKKTIILICLSLMMLCGCEQNQTIKVSAPYEICVDGNILSYYDDVSKFDKVGFDILSKALESSQSKYSNVLVDEDHIVRNIVIAEKGISTYRNISVGDDVKKIENEFDFEVNLKTSYAVLFDGQTEVNAKDNSLDKKDNFIWINYTTNGKTIEKIAIYDILYGKEMR